MPKQSIFNSITDPYVNLTTAINRNDPDFEYLGPTFMPPQPSDVYKRNFTHNKYIMWNKIYYPFNSFPSLPFDTVEATESRYAPFFVDKLNMDVKLTSNNNNKNNKDEATVIAEAVHFGDFIAAKNYTLGGGDGQFFNYHLSGNEREEQFTLVILSFRRESMLIDALEHYVQMPFLNTIIVVWNSVGVRPSVKFLTRLDPYLSTHRIHLVRSPTNSLNNRCLPYQLIETDAVLSVDDDVKLRADEVALAFRVWRENRERVVGFPARYHSWSYRHKAYMYGADLSCEYSMVLTGAAFFHRFYTYAYTHMMDKRVRERVDEWQNCEDIAFNMLVSHITRRPPLKVTVKWEFPCPGCSGNTTRLNEAGEPDLFDVPISMRTGHYERRSQCVQYFISIYGYNPLLYSQYRADSVLFKAQLPYTRQKCFKHV